MIHFDRWATVRQTQRIGGKHPEETFGINREHPRRVGNGEQIGFIPFNLANMQAAEVFIKASVGVNIFFWNEFKKRIEIFEEIP